MPEETMAAWLEGRRSAMRDLYVFLGRAHIAMLEHRAEQRGRKAGKAEALGVIDHMYDGMLLAAAAQDVQADGDNGLYESELATLRAIERAPGFDRTASGEHDKR